MDSLKKLRYDWIDSFKGISILGVMLIHSGAMNVGGLLGKVSSYGSAFVQAFFVISSFLTWLSLSKYKQFTTNDYIKWITRKYITLVPLFYIAIIAALMITGGNQYWAGDTNPKGFTSIVVHVTLMHGLFPKFCNSILGVEWYIGVLTLFYIIAPLVFRIINNLKSSVVLFGVSNFISIGLYEVVTHNNIGDDYSYIYREYAYTYGFNAQLPTLSLGIVLYYMIDKYHVIRDAKKSVIQSIVCMAIAFAILILYGRASSLVPITLLSVPSLYGLAFAVLFFGQSSYEWHILNNGLFRFLGKRSYGLYLFHCLGFFLFDKHITYRFGNAQTKWGVRYIFTVVVTLFAAYMIEQIIYTVTIWFKSKRTFEHK